MNELFEEQELSNVCCQNYGWKIVVITDTDIWGVCRNLQCPIDPGTDWHGVSHFYEEDLLERVDKEIKCC